MSYTYLLSDDTAVTSPIYAGIGGITKRCTYREGHDWAVTGAKEALPGPQEIGGKVFTHIAMETCKKCKWNRAHLYQKGDP